MSDAAKLLASPSLSKYCSRVGFSMNGIFCMVCSTTSVISKNPILFFKKAYTAISLAAFKTHGVFPPRLSASVAKNKFLNVFTSGSSKVNVLGLSK